MRDDAAGAGPSERERWEADVRLRERELALRERAQAVADADLALRQAEHARSRWTSPVFLGLLAAAVAGASNAWVARTNATAQLRLEDTRNESARILEVIKTNDPDKGATNLKFLLDAGLIESRPRREAIGRYLRAREPGQGVSLPAAAQAELPTRSEMYRCPEAGSRLYEMLSAAFPTGSKILFRDEVVGFAPKGPAESRILAVTSFSNGAYVTCNYDPRRRSLTERVEGGAPSALDTPEWVTLAKGALEQAGCVRV